MGVGVVMLWSSGQLRWVPELQAEFGPCRYRCLVALKHSLPASGDMCVSVLRRLCTVMPNTYRVGVSKVSPTHTQPLEAPRSGVRNGMRNMPKLKITIPEAVQLSSEC